MIYPPEKVCTKCKQVRAIDDFYISGKGYRISWCRACCRVSFRGTPEIWRRSRLKKLYGMTVEEYDALEAAQDGRCAVCGRPETRLGRHGDVKRLAVDHDHATGHIRGLLCMNCNLAVGLLEDDDQLAEALMDYLRSNREAVDNSDSAKVPPMGGPGDPG